MMRIEMKLGDLLKERGMTQKELAKSTGLTPTQISMICRGMGTGVNKKHLAKIADVLGVTDIRQLVDFAE
jgi:putative transcriptional regulator